MVLAVLTFLVSGNCEELAKDYSKCNFSLALLSDLRDLLNSEQYFALQYRQKAFLYNENLAPDKYNNRFQEYNYEGEFKWLGDMFFWSNTTVSRNPGNEPIDHDEQIIAFDGKRYYWAVISTGGETSIRIGKSITVLPAGLASVLGGVPPFMMLDNLLPYANLANNNTGLDQIRNVLLPNLARSVKSLTVGEDGKTTVTFGGESRSDRTVVFDEALSAFPTSICVYNPTYPKNEYIPFGKLEATKWTSLKVGKNTLGIPSDVLWTFYNQEGQPLVEYAQSRSEIINIHTRSSNPNDYKSFRPPFPSGSVVNDVDLNKTFRVDTSGNLVEKQ